MQLSDDAGHLRECGAEKLGALTPCRQCSFVPTSVDDQAKAPLLCDQNMPADQLRDVAGRIKAGEEPTWDESSVSQFREWIQENAALTKLPAGCTVAVWIPVVVMIVLAALLAWLVFLRLNAP